jgi:hypothetical protein
MSGGELPDLVFLGKTTGFGCQSLTGYHRHHRHTKAG